MTKPSSAAVGAWATIEAVAGQGVSFVVALILARMIGPADFGIFAIAAFFSGLATIAVSGALSTALIQRQSTDLDEESSLFWFTLAATAAIGAVLAIAAPWISTFYQFPTLAPLLIAVAIQLVASGLATVPGSILVRKLDFVALSKVALASAVGPGALAITCAWAGLGIWSLAVQLVTAAIINAASLWWYTGWRPALVFKAEKVVSLLRYSFWISLSGALETIYSQGAGLLIGKVYGSKDLGLFDRARSFNSLPGNFLIGVIGRAALPLFAQSTDDRSAQREGLRRASAFAMLLNLPVITVFVVVPDLVIRTLLGEAWLYVAPILQVLALSSVLLPIHAINLQLLLADGGASTYFRLEIAKKIIGIACVFVGCGFGIVGLAWGYVAASVFALALNTWPTRKLIGYGMWAQLADLAGLICSSFVMGAVILLLRPFVFATPLLALGTLLFAGGLGYIAAGLGIRVSSIKEIERSIHVFWTKHSNNPMTLLAKLTRRK